MVNYEQKRIFTNIISKFDTAPIQITDSINLSNSEIFINGNLFSGGAGGTTAGGGTILSSGGTSILLTSTTNISSTAIAFNIGGRTVFSFDGAGRALYFDPSGTGNRFWISSATMVADRVQLGGNGLGADPGKFLQTTDSLGTGTWAYVSTLQNTIGTSVSISSGGVYFRTGSTSVLDAGRIDSRRNWFLGLPSLSGNNDLVGSNDMTIIGGRMRYQGGGTPVVGQVLTVADTQGTLVLSTFTLTGASSFVVGNQIASGTTSVRVDGPGQFVSFTQGLHEIARFTGTGRLGLSNSVPSATLDVGGDAVIQGPLTVQPGTGGTGYVFTTLDAGGRGAWASPTSLFSGTGSSLDQWKVNSTIHAFQGILQGEERIRFSTGGAYLGLTSSYMFNVSGIVAAAGFASLSPLRFYIGPNGTGTEVVRVLDNGNFGIGTVSPLYKLQVAGSQSNTGALFVSTNINALGNITGGFFFGNGAGLTNIATSNVGIGSNRVDVFQAYTYSNINALQIGISSISSSVFSTLNAYNLAGGLGFYSTLSSIIEQTSNTLSAAIGPGAGQVVSSFSTSIGFALVAQFSTLSSYIVENTVQFSTLSSLILTTSLSDRAYASTIAFSTASTVSYASLSTFLSTGGIFTGSLALTNRANLWLSSGSKLAIGYKTFQDASGVLDVSGLVFAQGIRGIRAPFAVGVGTSTTTKLVAGGWTSSVGWRYSLEADLDLSGRIFRNGQLYTLDGTPDVYWTRNGSNIWFADGNVGIGVIDPAYPLDVAGRIRCFGVDVIQGPGPQVSTGQGQYVSPWQYAGSNIYYGQGGAAIGPGVSSVLNGVSWDVSGPVRIRFGPTYMSSLGVGIPYGSTLTATADIFGSLRARSLAVDSTGVFGGRVTARDFLSLSDQRFKKNIEVLSDPHSLLESIRGVRFDWIDSQKRDVGLVAQDVLKTLPEAVEGDEEKGFHVAYDKVIPVLLEAIKNLHKRVETLEKRLQTTI
jgi:prepilin-type processing-associated H-X9-DG protein